ncbi:ATP-binding cassette domain-containing protein [Alkalihalobacterium sp. APHAB7]|uniref:ATP-binding cassette domain-containing protein n=1 Tax=Alkalihalobacterium sp. APHAB7 TaxID=3402081 RepID=UPI003AAD8693
MGPFVKVKQVQKTIADFQLGPVDFEMVPGTVTALVGDNGAGKSTLIKIMMNLVKSDEGSIEYFGTPLANGEHWKVDIAYQPQELIGCNAFTGRQLVELVSKWYPRWNQSLFESMVETLDIPLKKRYGKLSQGVQKKLSLALTLAKGTDILILDEPTAHMDIPSKQKLMNILVEWMDSGDKAILIASHDAEDIRKLADYLVILRQGEHIGSFEKEELTEQYCRYWLERPLQEKIPGELERKGKRIVVTNSAEEAEKYFTAHQISWMEKESLQIEEIITLLLVQPR